DMRSRQQARIAQEIGKRCPGLDIHVHRRAIDRHLHARHAKISCTARNTLALRTLYSYLVRACLPHSAVRSASTADATSDLLLPLWCAATARAVWGRRCGGWRAPES